MWPTTPRGWFIQLSGPNEIGLGEGLRLIPSTKQLWAIIWRWTWPCVNFTVLSVHGHYKMKRVLNGFIEKLGGWEKHYWLSFKAIYKSNFFWQKRKTQSVNTKLITVDSFYTDISIYRHKGYTDTQDPVLKERFLPKYDLI